MSAFMDAVTALASQQMAIVNDACRRAIETGQSQYVVLSITANGRTLSEYHVFIAMPEMRRYEADRIEDFPEWIRGILVQPPHEESPLAPTAHK